MIVGTGKKKDTTDRLSMSGGWGGPRNLSVKNWWWTNQPLNTHHFPAQVINYEKSAEQRWTWFDREEEETWVKSVNYEKEKREKFENTWKSMMSMYFIFWKCNNRIFSGAKYASWCCLKIELSFGSKKRKVRRTKGENIQMGWVSNDMKRKSHNHHHHLKSNIKEIRTINIKGSLLYHQWSSWFWS